MTGLSEKKLLFIGGGTEQISTIKWAAEQGVRLFVVDINENTLGFKYAQATMTCDIRDKERILNFAEKHSVDGVISICLESAMLTISHIVESLGLFGLSQEVTENVTNKHRMRKLFESAGLPVPKYRLITPDLLEEEHFPGFDGPWVVKPVDNAGSRGVKFVNNRAEIKESYNNALAFTKRGEVLIEQFVPGNEISVEGFVKDDELIVETLSDKNRSSLPYLFDVDITYPSRYPAEIQREAIRQTKIAVKALGIINSPVHEELIVSPDGRMLIVEIAGRGPGSKVYTEIMPHVSGIYPNRLQVMQALGCQPKRILRNDRLKGATLYFFGAQQRARIKKFNGLDKVGRIPGVFECRMYKSEGDIVERCISGDQRFGQLITLADTLEEAIRAQKTAIQTVSVTLDNLDEKAER